MIVEASGTQVAVVGTEHTLATSTIAKTRVLVVDVATIAGAETVELKIYATVLVGGTERLFESVVYTSGVANPYTTSMACVMPQGGRFTLRQTGGTGRSYPWAIITLD